MHSIKSQSLTAAVELISLQRLSQLVESINLNNGSKKVAANEQPVTAA